VSSTRLRSVIARELRRLLVRDQPNRDAEAEQAPRRGAGDLADIIDMLTMNGELRKQAVRILAELEAQDSAR
jgi:hypothetical protein